MTAEELLAEGKTWDTSTGRTASLRSQLLGRLDEISMELAELMQDIADENADQDTD